MAHRRFTHRFRRRTPTAHVLIATMACALPRLLHAQSVPTGQATPASFPAYRKPVVALVQPANGGTVPQDKPVVVFAQRAPGDGVDVKSLTLSAVGSDITAAFKLLPATRGVRSLDPTAIHRPASASTELSHAAALTSTPAGP